jgi:hypothetical protein
MEIITWLLLLTILGFLVNWWRANPDDNPVQAQFPTEWLMILTVLLLLSAIPKFMDWRVEKKASRIMSHILGTKVRYTCGSKLNTWFDRSTDHALGYVRWTPQGPEKKSKLRHETCDALKDVISDPNDLSDPYRRLFSIHVLTHEAMHMVGEQNEAIAECKAIQRDFKTAIALGMSLEKAQEFVLWYYQSFYPKFMSTGYHSPECRRGGTLDENLPTSPWNL